MGVYKGKRNNVQSAGGEGDGGGVFFRVYHMQGLGWGESFCFFVFFRV